METMLGIEKEAKNAFVALASNFQRNKMPSKYEDLLQTLQTNFRALGCNMMNVNMHFLHSRLDYFHENPKAIIMSKQKYSTKTLRTWRLYIRQMEHQHDAVNY